MQFTLQYSSNKEQDWRVNIQVEKEEQESDRKDIEVYMQAAAEKNKTKAVQNYKSASRNPFTNG